MGPAGSSGANGRTASNPTDGLGGRIMAFFGDVPPSAGRTARAGRASSAGSVVGGAAAISLPAGGMNRAAVIGRSAAGPVPQPPPAVAPAVAARIAAIARTRCR